MTRPCLVCEAETNAFLCKVCLGEVERAIAEWPSLMLEVANIATRQTKGIERAGRPNSDDDEDLAELDEEYAWRLARIPAHLRTTAGRITLPSTPSIVNPAAQAMFQQAGNLLATWARHLAEARGLALNLGPHQLDERGRISRDAPMIGPTCPAHQHDYSVEGCGVHPGRCKQLHPEHVHDYSGKGCGHAVNKFGEPSCHEHFCRHWTCDLIRNGGASDQAAMIAGWLLANIDAIQFDEAAAVIYLELTGLHARMRRDVDHSPVRLYAGPCEAELPDKTRCKAKLFSWPPPRLDNDIERLLWERDNPIECDGYKPPLTDPSLPWAPGCGHQHQRDARRAWLVDDLEDRLLPWSMLEDALPSVATDLVWPSARTWFRWRKLIAAKTVIEDVEFYRGGDVMDLCRREQQRIKGNIERAQRGRMSA
jgi:hypothetical protein